MKNDAKITKLTLSNEDKLERLAEVAPDLKVVNCAGCKDMIVAFAATRAEATKLADEFGMRRLKGRVKGRPYCDVCFQKL